MAYTAILKRIRLLIPAEFDGHYEAVRRGFEAGDLTAPSLAISDMQLARRFRSSPAILRMKLRSRHLRYASIHNIEKPAASRRRFLC